MSATSLLSCAFLMRVGAGSDARAPTGGESRGLGTMVARRPAHTPDESGSSSAGPSGRIAQVHSVGGIEQSSHVPSAVIRPAVIPAERGRLTQ
jgi:hypothetical protein